jgi:hypothetical protein
MSDHTVALTSSTSISTSASRVSDYLPSLVVALFERKMSS